MNTTGYTRSYHREYDTTMMSEEILRNKELFKQFDRDLAKRRKEKTIWESIYKASDVIDKYMGDKAKDTLKNANIQFDRNVLLRNISYYVLRSKSEMLFPTYNAREEYKPEVAKLCGCTVSGDQGYGNEYNELLGLMYQYLYLLETDKDARKTFEDLNMAGKLKQARDFLKDKELFGEKKDSEGYYCSSLFTAVQSYSSFDAALQLIDRMALDKEGVLQFIKEMGENPQYIEEMVKDNGINTYNYYNLRKTIDRRKK